MLQVTHKSLVSALGAMMVLSSLFAAPKALAQIQEIKGDQIVIIKVPSGQAKVVRAKQMEIKDLVILITDADGKRAAWQKSLVARMLEIPDPAQKLEEPRIRELMESYDKAMTDFPESKDMLEPESRKLQAVLEAGKKQAEEQEANRNKAFQEATQASFDEAKTYTQEELALVIDPAVAATVQYPELKEKILDHLKPWQERLGYLKEGRELFEGKWLTKQEIRAIQEQKVAVEQEKNFQENAKLSFSSLVLPQTSMLVTLLIAVGTLLSVLFSFYHLATARGGNLSLGGALILLVGLGILGAYGYYTYQILDFTSELKDYWADSHKLKGSEEQMANPLPRMLFMASGSTNRHITVQDTKVSLEDTQLNVLMRKYLKLERKTEIQPLDVERLQMVVRLHADRIEFIDEAICLGKKVLIRYDVFYRSGEGSFSIYKQDVYVGGAKLPKSLASVLFREFWKNLTTCLAQTNLSQIYAVEKIEPGAVHLIWPISLSSVAKVKKTEPVSVGSEKPEISSAAEQPSPPANAEAAP